MIAEYSAKVSDGGEDYKVTICTRDYKIYEKTLAYAEAALDKRHTSFLDTFTTEELIKELSDRYDVRIHEVDFHYRYEKYDGIDTVMLDPTDRVMLLVNSTFDPSEVDPFDGRR